MKSPRTGNQTQPLVREGALYITTGDNHAFAISIETGEILLEYIASIREDARTCECITPKPKLGKFFSPRTGFMCVGASRTIIYLLRLAA